MVRNLLVIGPRYAYVYRYISFTAVFTAELIIVAILNLLFEQNSVTNLYYIDFKARVLWQLTICVRCVYEDGNNSYSRNYHTFSLLYFTKLDEAHNAQ